MIPSLYTPFRKWSEKGGVYIISDPHFDDEDMLYFIPDKPSSEEIVRRINSKIGKYDTLIILGDIGNKEWVKKIRGYKVLISGNHDCGLSNYEDCFNELYDGPLFITNKIILSHEPVEIDYALNIHGHVHVCDNTDKYHLNVSGEFRNYYPVNLGELIKNGILSGIDSIHRQTINDAIVKKRRKTKTNRRKNRSVKLDI